MSIANILTQSPDCDDPTYRMKLADELEQTPALASLETGRTYHRIVVGPEAMHAIARALRGI